MKISELIAELIKMWAEHGDLSVTIPDCYTHGPKEISQVDHVPGTEHTNISAYLYVW